MRFITATDRYILRLTLVPMLAVFVIAASLLILDKMLRLFEFVSTEGGPVGVVFSMLVNLFPEYAGLAVPLVLLLFGSVWMFPLITALVAGDIVAAEDRHQTLKTILTRSVERHQVFAGKVLAAFTYAIVAIAITGAVALVAGILASGFNSIVSLSGTRVSAGEGLGLVGLSLLF